jgi:Holliday junction resolvase
MSGKSFENELVNDINRDDTSLASAWPLGYSGSHATVDADILLTTARSNYAVEAKTASTEYSRVDNDQLERLVATENPYTSAVLFVKFSNRRPVTVQHYGKIEHEDRPDDWDEYTAADRFAFFVPEVFDPRVTDSGTLALTRPSLDDWPSSRASAPSYACLLGDCGLANDFSDELESPRDLLTES